MQEIMRRGRDLSMRATGRGCLLDRASSKIGISSNTVALHALIKSRFIFWKIHVVVKARVNKKFIQTPASGRNIQLSYNPIITRNNVYRRP